MGIDIIDLVDMAHKEKRRKRKTYTLINVKVSALAYARASAFLVNNRNGSYKLP